jgi:hypothetical protein
MRQYRCENCGRPLYFSNDSCGACGARVGFIPQDRQLASFEVLPDGRHRRFADDARQYRPCANYASACRCNWMVPVHDPNPLCTSCRLTVTIPDQSLPENRIAWAKLESAKRTWLYTILGLRLPVKSRLEDSAHGLAFRFLRQLDASKPVLTGHDAGEITINAIESDPVERERSKHELHEPYRTLLGHFRHESGHYYWDLLVRDTPFIEPFRQLFGDERQDYGQALERHYREGPAAGWQGAFVSGYATMHPWEDWAETWAHYLHMVDLLNTAKSWQLAIGGFADQKVSEEIPQAARLSEEFAQMVHDWVPLTLLANSLNRSLGHEDVYPFALSYLALRKMQFVHEVVAAAGRAAAAEVAGGVEVVGSAGVAAGDGGVD